MPAEELPILGPTSSPRWLASPWKIWGLAVAAGLVATFAGCAGGLRADDYPDLDDDLGGAAASLLSQAIQLVTVNPPGDERPVAELLVNVARREGLEARGDRDALAWLAGRPGGRLGPPARDR